MAKYSCEFKKEVVLRWVNAYKEFGTEGLMRSRKNEIYTFEFKLHVVELYPVFDSCRSKKACKAL
jgi:transposase